MKYKYLPLLAEQYEIILGSGSPRRVTLLEETGIKFRQVIPDLEESQNPGEPPYEYAERLAKDKAKQVAQKLTNGQIAIGCDTIVVLNGQVMGKPTDKKEAFLTLTMLAGNQHTVCTALSLADHTGVLASGYELTHVKFNKVSPQQIENYIASGEPMDKAGAYGAQGMGAFLVDSLEGNLDTVIGLPRRLLEDLAQQTLESNNRE